jgi:hypothetical protein
MSKVLRQVGQWLLIGTLLVSMGGHLALLQGVAWTRMLVDYSSKESLSEAVAKTFDGEHPCEMCKMVKKTKSDEEKKPLVKTEMKLDITLPVPVKVPVPDFTDVEFRRSAYVGRFVRVHLAMPMQPPRAV